MPGVVLVTQPRGGTRLLGFIVRALGVEANFGKYYAHRVRKNQKMTATEALAEMPGRHWMTLHQPSPRFEIGDHHAIVVIRPPADVLVSLARLQSRRQESKSYRIRRPVLTLEERMIALIRDTPFVQTCRDHREWTEWMRSERASLVVRFDLMAGQNTLIAISVIADYLVRHKQIKEISGPSELAIAADVADGAPTFTGKLSRAEDVFTPAVWAAWRDAGGDEL